MFEFARIIIWMHLLKAFTNLSIVITVLGGIALITFIILWGVGKVGGFCVGGFDENVPPIAKRLIRWILPVLIFFVFVDIFIPSPKKVIAYLALKQVDKYNIEEIDSMYDPQQILGTVDTVLKKAQDWLENNMEE